ncbi:DUF1538 family protein [Thermodesulfobacteriota bacterium]
MASKLLEALRDLAPIILVIVVFQVGVLQKPLPNLAQVLGGSLLVVMGMAFFVLGLEMGLFPLGEAMADAFARKGSLLWLLVFGFGLGFCTTIAEPALIAICEEASKVASQSGLIGSDTSAVKSYATGLRLTVAISVGLAILVGIIRILKGWPVPYLIIGGYVVVMLMTAVAPEEIIGIAYDSGGVTTSTVTVPLVTALGVGLSSSIRGRNPLIDGFGMIAFASLLPIIFVIVYGMIVFGTR